MLARLTQMQEVPIEAPDPSIAGRVLRSGRREELE